MAASLFPFFPKDLYLKLAPPVKRNVRAFLGGGLHVAAALASAVYMQAGEGRRYVRQKAVLRREEHGGALFEGYEEEVNCAKGMGATL
jgi:hypothetical protein